MKGNFMVGYGFELTEDCITSLRKHESVMKTEQFATLEEAKKRCEEIVEAMSNKPERG